MKGLICIVEGCNEPMQTKQMCHSHYKQWYRTGGTKPINKRSSLTYEQRFWANVKKGLPNDCWEWEGKRDKNGYGRLWSYLSNTRSEFSAHRLSYQMHKGEIPDGLMIRHTCHNPPCVNPAHLLVGTNADNMMDKKLAGRAPSNEDNPNCKFSNETIALVRSMPGPARLASQRFGMSIIYVKEIRQGKYRKGIK